MYKWNQLYFLKLYNWFQILQQVFSPIPDICEVRIKSGISWNCVKNQRRTKAKNFNFDQNQTKHKLGNGKAANAQQVKVRPRHKWGQRRSASIKKAHKPIPPSFQSWQGAPIMWVHVQIQELVWKNLTLHFNQFCKDHLTERGSS